MEKISTKLTSKIHNSFSLMGFMYSFLAFISGVILCSSVLRFLNIDLIKKTLFGAFCLVLLIAFLIFMLFIGALRKTSLADIFLWFLFYGFAIVCNILADAELLKVVGCETLRMWYLCGFLFFTFYFMEEKRRTIVLRILFTSYLYSISFLFCIFIIHATIDFFSGSVEMDSIWGCFQNGRLAAITNANVLGATAVSGCLVFLWLFLSFHKQSKRSILLLWIVCGVISIFTLSLTRSRGSIISVSCACGAYFFLFFRKKSCQLLGDVKISSTLRQCILSLIISIILIVVIPIPQYFYEIAGNYLANHYFHTENTIPDYDPFNEMTTLTDRTLIWKATYKMLDEEPSRWITGITSAKSSNIGVADVYEGRPEKVAIHAHNGYLETLLIFGVPGLLLLLIMLVRWLISAITLIPGNIHYHEKKQEILNLLPFIVAAVIYGMVEIYPFPFKHLYPLTCLFFISAGSVMGSVYPVYENQLSIASVKNTLFLKRRGIVRVIICLLLIISVVFSFEIVRIFSDSKYESYSDNRINKEKEDIEYWRSLYASQGISLTQQIMDQEQIKDFNFSNRRQLKVHNIEINLFEIGEVFNGNVAKSFIKSTYEIPNNPEDFYVNGKKTDASYWTDLEKQLQLEQIPTLIQNQYAVAVGYETLRKFPTEDIVKKNNDTEADDELINSCLNPTQSVIVIHESLDQEWVYVLTYGYGGWVKKDHLAYVKTRTEWLSYAEKTNFITVCEKVIYPDDIDVAIPMGTKLEIYEETEDGYFVLIPTRGTSGYLENKVCFVSKNEEICEGYMEYTSENLLLLAFQLMGSEYQWGGIDGGYDCSSFVRNIYACFGFELPRTAASQVELIHADNYDLKLLNDKEKIRKLSNIAPGALLYFPGHIMIYLGESEGTVFCISAVESLSDRTLECGEVRYSREVEISDMLFTTRKNGDSWLKNVEKLSVIR